MIKIWKQLTAKVSSLYGYKVIISNSISFRKNRRKEVFLYPKDPMVEKTSDTSSEQHFSIQAWLFRHRFKAEEGFLRPSFCYHHYLSTNKRQCPKARFST